MTSNNMHPSINIRFSIRSLAPYAFVAILSACGSSPTQDAKTASADKPVADTVPVFLLKADTLKKTVELPGELIPYEQTDLYAKVSGFVRTMKVDIGDRVHKGQTLAVIEAPEVNTQFAEAESSIQAAKSKWTASKDNYDRLFRASQSPSPGIVAPVDLERSRNQMMADSASYEAVRKQAQAYKQVSGYLTITAPFDGVITARKADPGALVGANAMLLTVQYNNTLRLRVAVPEMYVASASTARNVWFSVDAYPEQTFTGVLTRKTETIDPSTRTELWEFGVDNSKHLLKAGVFAFAKISIERSGPSFVIPASAIATTLEKKFVIKVTQGKADWIDVRQGITTDSGVEVFGKLTAGDTLLVKSTDERKPGTTAYWRLR
ncbi:MAG TPA: efflux RND transporter periplasmic adaptor subunit [Puia sp.]